MKAIILAGGKGTRLGKLVSDMPKPMLPVNGKPFLEYQLNWLNTSGIKNAILSIGYKKEIIEDHFSDSFNGIELAYCTEEKPLGTGGAIKKVLEILDAKNVLICNGDTYFPLDPDEMLKFHQQKNSLCTIAVKDMDDCGRYGTVEIDDSDTVKTFSEKIPGKRAFINGGIYLVNRSLLQKLPEREEFSFEKDFLEKKSFEIKISAFKSNAPFIDIGIPSDLKRAEEFLKEAI